MSHLQFNSPGSSALCSECSARQHAKRGSEGLKKNRDVNGVNLAECVAGLYKKKEKFDNELQN